MLRPAKKAPAQKSHLENRMNSPHYIGFDVHKKTISFCVKSAAGEIVEEGSMLAQRAAVRQWASARSQPWRGAMEATLFSGWIYDTLQPYGEQLEMAHPAKMKAISAGKKKSDTIDARTIADLLRYRSLVVSEAVRMKNKMAGLLMETGALYVKEKLHRKKYFATLLEELAEVPPSVIDLLRLSRGALEMFESTQKRLVRELLADPELKQRIERLMTIPAVGEITALTWALEVGDPQRFHSNSEAMSYCGLTAALKSSAGKQQRGPISKQRNDWLQTTLIEAAKLAPRWNPQLAALHARELERGHRNRATLAVARKLVAYCWPSTKAVSRSRCAYYWNCQHKKLPKKEKLRTIRRSTGRSSPTRGLGRGVSTPDAPYRLYRGRPDNPNS